MAFRWRADDGQKLNAGLVFQGFWTNIAKKPYIFVIFQGGSGPLVFPSGSAHVLRARSTGSQRGRCVSLLQQNGSLNQVSNILAVIHLIVITFLRDSSCS